MAAVAARAAAVVVVFTLGLGIGCTSSIFGVLDAMLLRPLPFYHSRELVAIKEVLLPVPGGAQQIQNSFMAGPDFLAWRRQQKSFPPWRFMFRGL